MLVPYGYFERQDQVSQKLYDAKALGHCIYRGFDLLEALAYTDFDEFERAVTKAKRVCVSLHIPLGNHFRTVYAGSPTGIYRDYRLSRFACYLITVNADSGIPAVARAQVGLTMRLN